MYWEKMFQTGCPFEQQMPRKKKTHKNNIKNNKISTENTKKNKIVVRKQVNEQQKIHRIDRK